VFAKRLLGTSHGRFADGRLHQVEPLGRTVKAAAIGDGNEGTQQFEIQPSIDPLFRSIIL
jgi:hypothetical protein